MNNESLAGEFAGLLFIFGVSQLRFGERHGWEKRRRLSLKLW
ncbi:hypothetical protein [Neobacillus sp. YIM B06451]|nr:hypothetical protein [Neobacillus sp. YIM B06451]